MKKIYLLILTLIAISADKTFAQSFNPATYWVAKAASGTTALTMTKSGSWGSGTNYNLVSPPSGITLSGVSGNNVAINIASSVGYGTYSVKLRNGSTGTSPNATATVNLYGTPTLSASGPASVVMSSTAALSGTFTANGNTVGGYAWSQTSGPAGGSSIASSTSTTPTISFTQTGTYVFTETVTYSHGSGNLTLTATVTVVVTPGAAVSIAATSATTILSGQTVSFASTNSNFHSGAQTYTWSITPSSNNGVTGATGASPVMTFSKTGTYTVKLTISVSGPSQSAISNTLTITVVSANNPKAFGTPMYTANMKGGHTVAGNTIMATYTSGNGNNGGTINFSANDNHANMQFVNVDYLSGNQQHVNSASAATVSLPAGTNTIKFARLYWGGRVNNSEISTGTDLTNLKSVKIRKGTSGAYSTITVGNSQINAVPVDGATNATAYQAWADITSFVSGTSATYTVADIIASTGTTSDLYGNYAGWSIVVAYQNDALDYYAVRLYDAFQQVITGAPEQSVTLNNFNAPSSPLKTSDAYLSAFVWEGDATYSGDYMKINGTTFSNTPNPSNNMWNGTISDTTNNLVHTQNPNLTMQLGVDIDQVLVGTGYGINPNATSVSIAFGTNEDQYFPSVLAFSMRIKDPQMMITKAALSATGDTLKTLSASQDLDYVIFGSNTGTGNASSTSIVDSIPDGVTYVPGSLRITKSGTSGPTGGMGDSKADNDAAYFTAAAGGRRAYITFNLGSGANSTTGGTLLPGDKFEVHLKVTTSSDVNNLTVTNIAVISTNSFLLGSVTVPATSSLSGPQGDALPTDLPIKLGTFTVTKQGTDAVLRWTTLLEINNDHFDIERSLDGVHFTKIGAVAGAMNSSLSNNYQYVDPIGDLSGVVYYRLRDVDIDNNGEYSKIIALHLDGSSVTANFSVYPNPFVSDIKMTITSTKETSAAVRIVNIMGQIISNRSVTLQQGSNVVVLSSLNSLQTGVYVVQLITEERTFSQKILKK